jgi:lipopolysaccharide transport system ATP-binding protein
MPDIVISVENLSKSYQLGVIGTGTFRGDLQRWWAKQRGLPDPYLKIGETDDGNREGETLWALNDVSMEVQQGDTLGIIGRNGAGKSTLLKILSQVTAPTSGEVKVKGRIASLLEVGTGFHPELTGRENIFLNGAILGMNREETKRKFAEIVDFSGVEKFIDTPVKRYSSGMYVRLAFAVAAHLESEILIVDEVLAVGDAEFQKKCLGKMGDVAHEGRTVLFVSHNMAAIENLCKRGIVLNKGSIEFIGTQDDAVRNYLSSFSDQKVSLKDRDDRMGSQSVRVTEINIRDQKGNLLNAIQSGQAIDICFHFEVNGSTPIDRAIFSIVVKSQLDVPLFLHHNRLTRQDFGVLPRKGSFIIHIPRLPLPPSTYYLTYSIIKDNSYLDGLNNAIQLTVIEGDFYGSGELPPATHGNFLLDASWHLKADSSN